jgi:type II secretory pathway component PulK
VTGRDGERGVALILALWVIAVLGVIAAGVVGAVRSELSLVLNLRARSLARYAAESGVIVARAEVGEAFRTAGSPTELAHVFARVTEEMARLGEQPLGDARFQIAMADVTGRIDLNQADAGTLLRLFGQFAPSEEAGALVDALLDWKDPDDSPRPRGAERAAYRRAGSPFQPPNHALRRLEELHRIAGFTDSIVDALAPFVTVRGDGFTNVNTAPEPVLAALPGIGRTGATQIAARRRDGVIESLVEVGRVLGAGRAGVGVPGVRLSTIPLRVLVVSRGWMAGHPLTHEIQAVFELRDATPPGAVRLVLRHWSERDL